MSYSNYKHMRLLLLYDLPMIDEEDRKIYEKFHREIISLGYHMLQYSVYTKAIQNEDNYNQTKEKVKQIIPKKGQLIILKVTENQYHNIIYLNGEQNKFDLIVGNNELVIFGGENIE